jgi:hypothetical protein
MNGPIRKFSKRGCQDRRRSTRQEFGYHLRDSNTEMDDSSEDPIDLCEPTRCELVVYKAKDRSCRHKFPSLRVNFSKKEIKKVRFL